MTRTRWQALIYSILLHVAFVLVGVFSFSFSSPMAMPQQLAIEATVVDLSVIEEMAESARAAERELEREREAEIARQRRAEEEERAELQRQEHARIEAEREAKEQEQAQRQAAEAAEQQAAERRAQEEAQRVERERQAELKRRQEAEQKRLAEERQREAALARERREQEARRQAEAEALLLAQVEEEERRLAASRSGLRDQYALLIKQKIERNWLRPESAGAGLECEVSVTQLPSREVVDVRIGRCNGDAATVRSIEAAVFKASPLPAPPDPALFERKLSIIFKPDA